MRHDDVLELAGRIQRASTTDEICAQLRRLTALHGVGKLIAGTVPRPGQLPFVAKSHILFAAWPAAWMERYLARGYVDVDPIIRRVRQVPGGAFRWREAEEALGVEQSSMQMMGEAREHGLAQGFAVPLVTLEGEIATVSFGGEKMDLSPVAARVLQLIGIFAIGRAFQLTERAPRPSDHLTAREIEVIRWTSVGKSPWDISVVLGISERAVQAHIRRATVKLGAANKTQAIAEAIRCGAIS